MRRRLLHLIVLVAAFLLPTTVAMAQTGKIAGEVTDGAGDPLPGVNVLIEGTTQGTVTDADGYYTILNVRPGTYNIRASFIGFTPQVYEGIRVNIDLTTEINFTLQEAAVGLDEVTVTATRPVVQRDVSASLANISSEDIENLPVTDIEQVVGLQAGFERGLSVRGAGGDQVQFQVDGLSMTSGIDNTPFSGVSYTAVEEVQVQTGGFSAEYGNVRSGLINVVTKEPSRDRYTVDAIVRYSGASQKNFSGIDPEGNEVELPNSDNSYYIRPLVDPAVAFEGTSNGAWESWFQDEYRPFAGWNAVAEAYNQREETNFTPQQLQQVFIEHYLRKDFEVVDPDYELDATIGGPVPGISRMLGDLRFLASFRQEQSAYPLAGYARDSFVERLGQGKLVSNIASGMKLSIQGLYATQKGLNRSEQGLQQLTTGSGYAYPWDTRADNGFGPMIGEIADGDGDNADRDMGEHFSSLPFHLMDVDRFLIGGQFTHTITPTTFYEVQLQRMTTDYFTRHVPDRDPNAVFSYLGGQLQLTEEPFGYTFKDDQDDLGVGMITSGHWGSGFDSTQVVRYIGRFDITSQLNRYSLLKAGVEYINSNYDANYGENDPEHPHNGDERWRYDRTPQQAAVYVQNKLEFKGMIANVGLRLDYFDPGGDWYEYATYDRALSAQFGVDAIDEVLGLEPMDSQLNLSPRLGISFPITADSKLYFNYGHFRNMLNPTALFEVRSYFTGAVRGIGNPNHPMPKTVAYELGYEQNIADQFLLRLAGFYRDQSLQPREVQFVSVDDLVDYRIDLPWNYSDVRGFEMTLQKTRGAWVRGFLNYTYLVRKSGNFGFSLFDENATAQSNFVRSTTEHYPSAPIPEPFARFNVEVLLPEDLGPAVGGTHLLGDWRINFLGEWRDGQSATWDGQSLTSSSNLTVTRELRGNVDWRDYYMLDMRLSKNFNAGGVGDVQFFVDFNNVLNIRHLYWADGTVFFDGDQDLQTYMRSLHLPQNAFPDDSGADYPRVFGDDKVGDYRKKDVAFVPIFAGPLPETGESQPLYFVPTENQYYQWNGSAFVQADQGQVSRVLDDKAYIDMPNRTYSTFLNPRNVFFGLRLSF